ncbi:hypothetical protein P280DRAFT_63498 [Massarina eburnea CBS 473.64]|uniref:Uncharacterized protein n=1 Tax=Massarina eburnea CBS 473.64 TaxID=1395130 RepID=A0A6A6RUZ9_9PLEO|nr:hypothetical protein P280DRAFT_63498 [Massarina eburnea CBS 473.64]
MAPTTPSPQTWTLRLKARKTTVVLHVDPLQTFASMKSDLHAALVDTSLIDPSTREPIPLPSSPSDIQFGRPIDRADPQLGFTLGEWELPSDDEEDNGKGKGKAKTKGRKSDVTSAVKDCPKGAGLKDRDVLAFRWRGDGTAWEDDEEQDDDIMLADEVTSKKDTWGVKLASFDDQYGVENEADLGLPGEFEG